MEKTCTKCNLQLPIEEFAVNKRKKYGVSSQCKACHREYSKTHYSLNRNKYLEKARTLNIKHFEENSCRINEYKAKNGCSRCGEDDPVCLDFHHINEKSFSISKGKHYSWEKLLVEISKCELLCANCHRKEHYSLKKQL